MFSAPAVVVLYVAFRKINMQDTNMQDSMVGNNDKIIGGQ
jgi:hypothetical protein